MWILLRNLPVLSSVMGLHTGWLIFGGGGAYIWNGVDYSNELIDGGLCSGGAYIRRFTVVY